MRGRIDRVQADGSFGFITAEDGERVYFRPSECDGEAHVGSEVEFDAYPTDRGMRAVAGVRVLSTPSRRVLATVYHVRADKGFAFAVADGVKFFVHLNEVADRVVLSEGDLLEADLVEDAPRGPAGIKVRVVKFAGR